MNLKGGFFLFGETVPEIQSQINILFKFQNLNVNIFSNGILQTFQNFPCEKLWNIQQTKMLKSYLFRN